MAPDAPMVLIVDDEPLNVDLLEQELGAAGYRTASAASGREAIAAAVREQPDLILLDVMMSGLSGYDTCERLKGSEATRVIPVIFLTALKETFEKVRAFRAGAVDYVTKPFDSEELLARVGTHIALRREVEAHQRSKAAIRLLVDERRSDHDRLIGESEGMRRVRDQIAQVAPTDSTVLIQGETGTGKELVARAIHDQSARRERAFIKLNCAALPRDLVESELFGHEKGAFTGAVQLRRGRFELADGGTLLLDEVGELPPEVQAKLLRVLQEREFERLGGARTLRVDVRLIAATNRDLHADVRASRFRADLYFRLNVFPVWLPPLRDRRPDISALLDFFVRKSAHKMGREIPGVSPAFVEWACRYDWPGNIRELENVVERASIVARGGMLEPDDAIIAGPSIVSHGVPIANATLRDIERAHIVRVLHDARWRIEGEQGAARILGVNPSTLRGRMRKLGIRKAP